VEQPTKKNRRVNAKAANMTNTVQLFLDPARLKYDKISTKEKGDCLMECLEYVYIVMSIAKASRKAAFVVLDIKGN
jgi:hypothetical protein